MSRPFRSSTKWRSHFADETAVPCAHSLSVCGGQLAHLWTEMYFSGVHAAGKIDCKSSRPAGRELCEALSTV